MLRENRVQKSRRGVCHLPSHRNTVRRDGQKEGSSPTTPLPPSYVHDEDNSPFCGFVGGLFVLLAADGTGRRRRRECGVRRGDAVFLSRVDFRRLFLRRRHFAVRRRFVRNVHLVATNGILLVFANTVAARAVAAAFFNGYVVGHRSPLLSPLCCRSVLRAAVDIGASSFGSAYDKPLSVPTTQYETKQKAMREFEPNNSWSYRRRKKVRVNRKKSKKKKRKKKKRGDKKYDRRNTSSLFPPNLMMTIQLKFYNELKTNKEAGNADSPL